MVDSAFLNIFISTSLTFDLTFWLSLIVVIVLLIVSGLVSASEVAFFSLTPEEKEEIRYSQEETYTTSVKLMNAPKDLLATILITNNFVNIGIVILSNYIFSIVYPVDPNFVGVDYLRAGVEIAGITFVILMVGEILPKVYAARNSLRFVRLMSSTLYYLQKLPPISWLRFFLVNGTEVILKYARKRQIDVSTDDLETAIALTREENTSPDEQRILEGIVNFGNTDVRQIMRSRVDAIAANEDITYAELMELILNSGYSRIPVFKDTFDNVTGILFVKDLLGHLNAPPDFEWQKIIRQPFFVPENKKIDDLLKEFQEKKMHMAVVVDEYGGSSGIVTLEDVLEEIIGEITDEFDDEDIVYTKVDESTYLFEGKTSLVDMYKVLGIDGKAFEESKGESDSIGGFLVEQSGRILRNKEFYVFENFKFGVESSDKKRVKMVKVIKL